MDIIINIGLVLTYLMIGGAAIAAIAFPVMFLAKNPAKAKSTLLGVGVLLLITLISFLIASGDVMNFPGAEKFGMTEASTKRVGTGLIVFYILSFGAIGAVLYSELGKLFKK
jgi:hypothetical protein